MTDPKDKPTRGVPFANRYVLNPDVGVDAMPYDSQAWAVYVKFTGLDDDGNGLWWVERGQWDTPMVYRRDGSGFDHPPYEPTDKQRAKWRAAHKMPLAEALALAESVLPTVVVNGMTYADAVERLAVRRALAPHAKDEAR